MPESHADEGQLGLILEETKVGPLTGSWWHLQLIGQQMLRPKSELSG